MLIEGGLTVLGIAILGQDKACPDRDDNEHTRPFTTRFIPPLQIMRPFFVTLELAYDIFDALLTYTSDDVVLFRQPSFCLLPMDAIAFHRGFR